MFYLVTFEMDEKKLFDRNPVQKHCGIVRQQVFFVRIVGKIEGYSNSRLMIFKGVWVQAAGLDPGLEAPAWLHKGLALML